MTVRPRHAPRAERVAVVTDAAAGLPTQLRAGITVVPLSVSGDGQDLDPAPSGAELAGLLRSGARLTTAAPGVFAFQSSFAALASQGYTHAVAVLMSTRLSATVMHAQAAASGAPLQVEVVDTASAAMGEGFAAVAAHAAAPQGAQAAADAARQVAAGSEVCFAVESLEHLRRGGRISAPKAALGGLLGLRPVLRVSDGGLALHRAVPGRARAEDELVAMAARSVGKLGGPGGVRIAVHHLGEARRAAALVRQVASATGVAEADVVLADVPAVLACHAGPGVMAVVVAPVEERVL